MANLRLLLRLPLAASHGLPSAASRGLALVVILAGLSGGGGARGFAVAAPGRRPGRPGADRVAGRRFDARHGRGRADPRQQVVAVEQDPAAHPHPARPALRPGTDRRRRSPARPHPPVRQREDLLAAGARRPDRDLRRVGAAAVAGRAVRRLQRDSQESVAEGSRLEEGRSGRSVRHRGGPAEAGRVLPQEGLPGRPDHACWRATSRRTAAPSS